MALFTARFFFIGIGVEKNYKLSVRLEKNLSWIESHLSDDSSILIPYQKRADIRFLLREMKDQRSTLCFDAHWFKWEFVVWCAVMAIFYSFINPYLLAMSSLSQVPRKINPNPYGETD